VSTQTIIVFIAVAILFVLVITQIRRGPRVTQIDRIVRKNGKDER